EQRLRQPRRRRPLALGALSRAADHLPVLRRLDREAALRRVDLGVEAMTADGVRRRLPIVGVMGSGSSASALAEPLGAALAELPIHLLTGGGAGVMAA